MATADEEKFKIPLFDGTTFSNWKFRIETLLKEHDLLDVVRRKYMKIVIVNAEDDAETRAEKERILENLRKKDRKCKSLIIQRVLDSHLEYVKDKETAYEIWVTLSEIFERKGIATSVAENFAHDEIRHIVGLDDIAFSYIRQLGSGTSFNWSYSGRNRYSLPFIINIAGWIWCCGNCSRDIIDRQINVEFHEKSSTPWGIETSWIWKEITEWFTVIIRFRSSNESWEWEKLHVQMLFMWRDWTQTIWL